MEKDFVRQVLETEGRCGVKVGFQGDDVLVAKLPAHLANKLEADLRRVLGDFYDKTMEVARQRYKDLAAEDRSDFDEIFKEAFAVVVDSIDTYVKDRQAKGKLHQCCRTTANDIKARFKP